MKKEILHCLECTDDLDKNELLALGEALGIHNSTLQRMSGSSIVTFRGDIVDAWLKKKDDVLFYGTPSWNTLIQALRRMGRTKMADKIKKEKLSSESLMKGAECKDV